MAIEDQSHEVLTRIVERTTHIVGALSDLGDGDLTAPSELPGWSRLTIACHLRYGAEALRTMTDATLHGRTTSYYPGVAPGNGQALCSLPTEKWRTTCSTPWRQAANGSAGRGPRSHLTVGSEVVEPSDNPDLGHVSLSRLPLLRLTEVEVHGSDLGLDLPDWSSTFIEATLPMRLEALNNHTPDLRRIDANIEGAWLLVAADGPIYRVSVTQGVVASVPTDLHSPSRVVLEATSRDLLALLLGRPLRHAPRVTGDLAFGEAFPAVFPGP